MGILLRSGKPVPGLPEGSIVQLSGTVYYKETVNERTRLYLKHLSVSDSSDLSDSSRLSGRLLAYLSAASDTPVGSRVLLCGTFTYPEPASNPGGFASDTYYNAKGIHALLRKAELLASDRHASFPGERLYELRRKLTQTITLCLDAESAGLLSALLTGDRSLLSKDTKLLFQDCGILHLLAISGLHISILGMQLFTFLNLFSLSHVISALISCSLIFLYGLMIGSPVSAMRAILMFCITIGAQLCGRTYDAPTSLTLSSLLLLMKNPVQITQAGFLYSYASVIGIYYVTTQFKRHRWQPLFSSLSSFAITLPISAMFYYRVPVYGILLNLLVLPMMPVVLLLGAAGAVLGSPHPLFGQFLLAPLHYAFPLLLKLCRMIHRLPGAVFVVGKPSGIRIFFYYLFLALLLYLLFSPRSAFHSASLSSDTRPPFRHQLLKLFLLLIGFVFCLTILFFPQQKKWTATFLDVGQGDGCCIQTENGHVWMFDGGSTQENLSNNCLLPFLYSQRISTVDVWVVSHFDADHISGLTEILSSYEKNLLGENISGVSIGKIVIPKIDTEKDSAEQLKQLAADCGIPVLSLASGDLLHSGDTVMRILAPFSDRTYTDSNEGSLTTEISYQNRSILMTGDLEGDGEQWLISSGLLKDVDILKTAHHGSRNSTPEEFLKQITPKIAVISCGKDNRYGHPHRELLERLFSAGCRILRTDKNGAVTFTVSKDGTVRLQTVLSSDP